RICWDIPREADLYSRHCWLMEHADALETILRAEPHWYDVEAAGWFAWGSSLWIGGGWCVPPNTGPRDRAQNVCGQRGIQAKKPYVFNPRGVQNKRPHIGRDRGVACQRQDIIRDKGVHTQKLRVASNSYGGLHSLDHTQTVDAYLADLIDRVENKK